MTDTGHGQRELDYVAWLARTEQACAHLRLGIGDDMAVVDVGGGQILMSSDMLLDGVHFDTRCHTPEQIGRKAVACNLSDCAAMGARPVAVTVSLALPPEADQAYARSLMNGMRSIAEAFDTAVAGGDTTSWSHPLAIDVAVVAAPVEGIAPISRAGARVGHHLYVTGPLGGSLLGKHLTFTPRVREASALAKSIGSRLSAMVDITDGLALDLWRVCLASGVGAVLNTEALVALASDDAHEASRRDGRNLLDHVLHDGEDFELLVATNGPVVDPPIPLVEVGVITETGLMLRGADGQRTELKPEGYTH